MDTARDGSLNRHGGEADMESNEDEQARERQEAIDAKAAEMMGEAYLVKIKTCEACDAMVMPVDWREHPLNCELAQAMAAAEVDK